MDPEIETMSDFFDNRASIYDQQHLGMIAGGIESKNLIASYLPQRTQTLLNLGIGTGLELDAIYQRFPNIAITGIDISIHMLAQLKDKYPNKTMTLRCANYLTSDLGHNLYDAVVSVMSLHHYNHPTKTTLYRKIHNCLKSDGLYIECDYMLSELDYENPDEIEKAFFEEWARIKAEKQLSETQDYHFDTPCTVSNQKKMLKEAGFVHINQAWHRKNAVILVATPSL
ncbi:MAG: class I SAM-dependent methyltransferase [Peptococcaceae bacterium]|nr:class I SAM-dependent methyltransferase [Peptococcaceae bacterium]